MKLTPKFVLASSAAVLLGSPAGFAVPVTVNVDSSYEGIADYTVNQNPLVSGFYEVGWLSAGVTETQIDAWFAAGDLASIKSAFNTVLSFSWTNGSPEESNGNGLIFSSVNVVSDHTNAAALAAYKNVVTGGAGKQMFGWIRDDSSLRLSTQMAFVQNNDVFPTANDINTFGDFSTTFGTDSFTITGANVWTGSLSAVQLGGGVDLNEGSPADGQGLFASTQVLETAQIGDRVGTLYWDADANGSAATGGTGNWDTSSSLWRSGSSTGTLGAWPTSGRNSDAHLGGTAGTITLTTGISVNDIVVAPTTGTDYTIAGATQTLTLNGATKPVIDIAGGKSLTVTSGLNGTYGFTKDSAGTLVLDSAPGTDTLVGDITVNGGTLQAGSATNNGASQALRSNAVDLAAGASLTTVGTTIDLRVGALSGSGSVTPAVGGAINVLARKDATFSGTITTTGGLNLRGGNGTTQTFNGNLTGLSGTIGVNSGATLNLSGTGDSTSGVIGGTTIALRGGTFTLDNSGGNTSAAAGRVGNAALVTFNGGTFSLIGNSAGTSETVGAFTMNGGAATISVTNNGGTGAQLTFSDSGSLRDQTSGTVNFVGSGTGTLGSAGNNPRITFTGAVFTGTGGLLANSAAGTTVGWATVNGSEWAGLGANGIVAVAPTLTASTNVTLQTSGATSVTVFNPSANQTLTGAVAAGALKFAPTANNLTLNIGTNSLTTFGVMLAGANDFSITGTTGTLWGTGAGTRYAHVVNASTTLNVVVGLAGAQQPFTKSGAGFLNLNGSANQLNFTSVQNVNLLQGVMRGTTTSLGGGASSGGAFTTLNLYGGVLEISGGGSFSRALNVAGAAGGGGLKWDGGGTARGDGGFSAIGGNATVTLVTTVGGATAAAPVWNAGGFVSNGYALVMGSTKADSRIDFTNNIGLDDGTATNNYFGREIRVIDNTGSSNDVARLFGVIFGSANADLLKTGDGALELTGTNTYAGNTLIQQGTLIATNGSAIPNGSAVVLADIAGAKLQLNNSETIGALSGGGTTGGNVDLQSNALTVGDKRDSTFGGITSGSGALVKQGGGTLTLTGANSFTGTTTISEGTLELNRTTADNSAIPTDANTATASDIVVNGGNLVLAASEQIGNTGSITMTSGSLGFSGSGRTETIDKLTNSGGTFTTGANTLEALGATVTWSGGTNTISTGGLVSDKHWVVTGGTNTVEQNGLLRVQNGSAPNGLIFGGTASPTITLDSHATDPGEILLKQDVTVDSTLTSGTAQILSGGSAAVAGRIDMNGGTRTWSVNNGSATVDLLVSATLDNGALTKTDAGTLKLTGANTFTGDTTVNGGTLEAGGEDALGATASISVNTGGTLLLSGTGDRINDSTTTFTLDGGKLDAAGLSETFGALTLTANSIIDFGAGASILSFADSSGASWGAFTLSLWNWSGLVDIGGGTDQLRFASNGLTVGQLSQIHFFSDAGVTELSFTGSHLANGFIGSLGEVVPVPEPSSVLVGLALFGLAGWRERRTAQARRSTSRRRAASRCP